MSPLLLLGALLLAAGQPAVAATGDADKPAHDVWTPQQAKKLFARIVERQPFLGSDEARAERATIDHFFHAEDYAALRGNPLMGYWSAGRFRWRGIRVAWDGITPTGNSARAITSRAWDAAFEHIARKYGLTVDPKAAVRIRGACLGAVVNPTAKEPNRGVLVEIQIDSPTGPFRYRLGMGKPTIEDAVGASLDWAVSFARALSEEETP